ncbi:hypothetical protein CVT25_009157 [Psilocybe cyanescens]|uniref:DUF6534 domain-containing protein n=1 Tax=Psilocybe cyanescens TaxID=93625 RepID=A0A409XDR6_PSICY|nr:hypothetical protein CVT25_009157 [Psilocybe cyanescens]
MATATFAVDLVLLSEIVAPVLISVFFTSFWLGLICLLSYRYYCNFPSDASGIKATVGTTVTFQTFNTIVMARMSYYYLVASFGSPDHLLVPVWEFGASILMLTLIDYMVQTLYAYRLGLLIGKDRYILRGLVLALPLGALGFGMKVTVVVLSAEAFTDLGEYAWIVIVWFACLAGCDIILTTSQAFYLHYHRTGIARTNHIVNTLILYITTTALVASLLIIIQLSLFVTLGGWNYAQTFLTFQTSAIRIICLLANLSSRKTFSRDGSRISPETGTNQGVSFGSEGRSLDFNKTNVVDFRTSVALNNIMNISDSTERSQKRLSFVHTNSEGSKL